MVDLSSMYPDGKATGSVIKLLMIGSINSSGMSLISISSFLLSREHFPNVPVSNSKSKTLSLIALPVLIRTADANGSKLLEYDLESFTTALQNSFHFGLQEDPKFK